MNLGKIAPTFRSYVIAAYPIIGEIKRAALADGKFAIVCVES